jgi:hypothetical protein
MGGLGTTDTVLWGVAGDETGNPVASPFARSSSPSNIGVTATGVPNFLIAVEGSFWNGNFSSGDVLLWGNDNSGAVILTFSTAIQGIGFQIQRNVGGAFNATLTAFSGAGGTGTNFGSVNVNGTSSIGMGNNTAPFLGLYGSLKDIVSVRITMTGNPSDFAINYATLLTQLNVVPEPQTYLLTGLGLIGLAFMRRRA